ncbi:MAG: nitronate monooxygenase [Deltaproteobacteria bacterium]|nr:nitronate monooxygenase [Deltaproteobacteria bacterium]
MKTRLCETLGIDVPIFAFSHCRDVVAAVSRAGGMGVLGALAFTPEELELELKWIDAHVDGKPYGVDTVMPVKYEGVEQGGMTEATLEAMIPAATKQWVEEVLTRYEVPRLPDGVESFHGLLGWSHAGGRAHVDIALAHPIKLIVNALGPPPPDVIEAAHKQGVKVAALVGTVAQARKQVEAGVDIIVAQGTEAGGHTGEIGSMVLVPDVVDAVKPVPVLAAGGIGSGRQVAAAIALGADGAWTGSIWLAVKESDTHPLVIEKMLKATSSDTVRSRCISGKPARQLKTAWTEAWDGKGSPGTLPMPLQFMVTAEAQTRITRYADAPGSRARELIGTPVGQIVGRMTTVKSAAEVIHGMIDEYIDTVDKMQGLLGK